MRDLSLLPMYETIGHVAARSLSWQARPRSFDPAIDARHSDLSDLLGDEFVFVDAKE